MMRCETVKELLEAYIEGELSDFERKAVEAHISGCEPCKRELALTRSIPRLVGSLSTPPVPEDIISNTLKRLHEPSAAWWSVFLPGRWQFAAVASLLLVAVLLGIGYQRMERGAKISEAEAASAMKELELALGIVSAATQRAQYTVLAEGAKILDVTRGRSDDAMQAISQTRLEVSEKLWRNLIDLAQLNL